MQKTLTEHRSHVMAHHETSLQKTTVFSSCLVRRLRWRAQL